MPDWTVINVSDECVQRNVLAGVVPGVARSAGILHLAHRLLNYIHHQSFILHGQLTKQY